ncbi:MAG: Ni/Fe hydrogenase subunit alpha, partial [Actinomycetia bacterium]|nr:Ni/Fe hydrogenase subunit alpha [Actinomycetes bacterium]
MPRITSKICGVCPTAHHIASTKTLDAPYKVEPTPAARAVREAMYNAFMFEDHLLHFYFLGGPDFVMGPDADPAIRNILGMIDKLGIDTGKTVIGARAAAHEIVKILGGKTIHMVTAIAGGVTKGLTKDERDRIVELGEQLLEFAKFTIKIVDDVVLANQTYLDLILSDPYTHRFHSMGTVDDNNHINFYDGLVRVVDVNGQEIVKYHPRNYLDHIAERVEKWSYL